MLQQQGRRKDRATSNSSSMGGARLAPTLPRGCDKARPVNAVGGRGGGGGRGCPPPQQPEAAAPLHRGMLRQVTRAGTGLRTNPASHADPAVTTLPLQQHVPCCRHRQLLSIFGCLWRALVFIGGNQENPGCWAAAAARCNFSRCFPNYAAPVPRPLINYCCQHTAPQPGLALARVPEPCGVSTSHETPPACPGAEGTR